MGTGDLNIAFGEEHFKWGINDYSDYKQPQDGSCGSACIRMNKHVNQHKGVAHCWAFNSFLDNNALLVFSRFFADIKNIKNIASLIH